MAKTYDATLNDLIGARPDDWAVYFARLAGIPPGPAEALDTDLATTVQADRVFRIAGAVPVLLHLELESTGRLGIPRELLRYNALLDHQYNAPVESVLVVLRPKARASDQTGTFVRLGPSGRAVVEFRYHVERVWERTADHWLAAGPGLAPLALLTDEAVGNLEPAVGRFRECVFDQTVDVRLRQSLVSSSYMLCGLRHEATRIAEVFQKMSLSLEESTTYQLTIQQGVERGMAQGMAQGMRNMLILQGTERFGPPTPEVADSFARIADAGRLERMAARILGATGWSELLAVE